MRPKRLTDLKIRNLKTPTKRIEIPDPQQPGLWLQLHPTGRRSWAVRYRRRSDKRNRCLTLDGFPSLAIARKLAQVALDDVAQGGDPCAAKQEQKRRQPIAADDVESAFRLFLVKHVTMKSGRPIRLSSRLNTAAHLGFKYDAASDAWVPTGGGAAAQWKGRKLADIKPHDVRAYVEDIAATAPISANRALSAIKSGFNFLRRRFPDALPSNPTEVVDKPSPETSRDRVLSDVELASLWRCATSMPYPFGDLVRLLALSACRKDELRLARWSEIDLAAKRLVIPTHRVKTGREHVVPLTDMMLDILHALPRVRGCDFVFSIDGTRALTSTQQPRLRLHQAMSKDLGVEVPHWTLHDLRRTAATNLQRLGFPVEVCEAVLNHSGGAVSGVAAVYSRHRYDAEKRLALEALGQQIQHIVDGGDGSANVVPLRSAA